MHKKSESKIGQQDRQDRVVQLCFVWAMLGSNDNSTNPCNTRGSRTKWLLAKYERRMYAEVAVRRSSFTRSHFVRRARACCGYALLKIKLVDPASACRVLFFVLSIWGLGVCIHVLQTPRHQVDKPKNNKRHAEAHVRHYRACRRKNV